MVTNPIQITSNLCDLFKEEAIQVKEEAIKVKGDKSTDMKFQKQENVENEKYKHEKD